MAVPDRPAVDIAGFVDALDAKRLALGSDVVFLQPPSVTWPPGTALDPATGGPYDPMIEPVSSGQSSGVVRCGVFFKAVNRGGAEHAIVESAIGLDEHTRIFAIAPIDARPVVQGAVTMIFHGERWQIQAVKEDEIVRGFLRLLVYAAAYG